MTPPENFTRGDIPDPLFADAFEAALEKKSRISISQILKHGGMSLEIIDQYTDTFISEARKTRMRSKRPHLIIGWVIIATGVITLIYMLKYGYLAVFGIVIVMAGIIFLSRLRD
ncbi:MAG: hypothetical protein P1V20_31955 [Verrucomicrobiales bacterium]|nr:hypothetical protein [Verrucomicrobiales bacterium]